MVRLLDQLEQSGRGNGACRAASVLQQADEFVLGQQLIGASNVDQDAVQTVNLDEIVDGADSLDHFFAEATGSLSRKAELFRERKKRDSRVSYNQRETRYRREAYRAQGTQIHNS